MDQKMNARIWGRTRGDYNFPVMERVIYGTPAAQALLAEVERLGKHRIFLVVSNSLNRNTDEIERVKQTLGARFAGLYDQIPQHTTRESVIAAANAASAASADLVVAIGGGSVVDAGKAMLICMSQAIAEPDGFDDLMLKIGADGKPIRPNLKTPTLRLIAVPSTLSGGEYNAGALVTDAKRKLKQILVHPLMMPVAIILDPDLTRHAPEPIWFGSGLRAMDHGIEALRSLAGNPLTDGTALHGIRLLREGLMETKADPGNLNSRMKCQSGSWLSAAGLQARVPMGASHAIGHVLGGTCDVSHFFCTPVMMPSVLRFNRPVTETAQGFLAEALGHPGEEAAAAFSDLIDRLSLPKTLSAVGVGPDKFPLIAQVAMNHHFTHANPRAIRSPSDIVDILTMAA